MTTSAWGQQPPQQAPPAEATPDRCRAIRVCEKVGEPVQRTIPEEQFDPPRLLEGGRQDEQAHDEGPKPRESDNHCSPAAMQLERSKSISDSVAARERTSSDAIRSLAAAKRRNTSTSNGTSSPDSVASDAGDGRGGRSRGLKCRRPEDASFWLPRDPVRLKDKPRIGCE